jgi:hypothetical protein
VGSGGYSGPQANRVLARWPETREELARRLIHIDSAIDLDSAVRPTEHRIKRRLARIAASAHVLPIDSKTHQFPDLEVLRDEAIRLRAEGKAAESHLLSRTIRDYRLMIMLASRMSRSMAPRSGRPRPEIRSASCRFCLVAT